MLYKIMFRDYADDDYWVIDIIDGPVGYTASDYIRDCREQMSPEWNDMLDHGTVRVSHCHIIGGRDEFHIKSHYKVW